jgi:chemotaxis protein MotB
MSLMMAVSAFGCGYSEEEMQVKKDRIDQLTHALDKLSEEHTALQDRFKVAAAENAQLSERLKQMGMSVEDSKKSMDELNKLVEELRTKERQASARLATFRGMLEKFKQMIASGKLRVRIVRGRMVVELSENILFDSGKSELKKEGTAALQEVAGVLASIPDREFQIAGHTDNIPIKSAKFRSNWDLSTARAVEVLNFMVAAGMEAKRVSAAGYADQSPVAGNDSPENKAKNRRIEITLVPNLDDLPPIDEALKDNKENAAATP